MSSPLQPPPVVGEYISLPVTVDPDQLMAEALAGIAAKLPGWVPGEGHLEVAVIEEMARMCAQTARVASAASMSIFQYYGQSILGIAPIVGAQPVTTVRWEAFDFAGHTIPAGTTLAFVTGPGTEYLFITTADVSIPLGSGGVSGVPIRCLESTGALNGVPAASLVVIDAIAWTGTVTAEASPTGGADSETQVQYLARLRQKLSLLTPRPILAQDFAAIARDQPGVARAVALNNYDPANPAVVTPLAVTVCGIDAAGQPLDATTTAALQTAVAAQRPVNWLVKVTAPTYSIVNIAAQIVAKPGYSQAALAETVRAALVRFLSPERWGGEVDAGGTPTPAWTNTTTVRYLTVVGIIAAIPGVAYVAGAQVAAPGGTYASTDLPLPGAVPLAQPGTVSVNVS